MICPYCHADNNKVTDSRPDKNQTWRRRKCNSCSSNFHTIEFHKDRFDKKSKELNMLEGELGQNVWAVVTSKEVIKTDLTYLEAMEIRKETTENSSDYGTCIVTNDTAFRMLANQNETGVNNER